MKRREFLTAAGGLLLTGVSSAYAVRRLIEPGEARSGTRGESSGKKYGMVVDLTKCRKDCTACVEACRKENNVAHFGDNRWDNYWIRKATLHSKDGHADEKPVLLLCNHCDKPPCAQVCPVQATFKRDDGIVIVDHHRCIGCRYCMIACPYNARQFNFKETEDWVNKKFPKRSHGVAEACTLCAHLLEQGRQPACVEAGNKVGAGVLTVGDMNDPESDIARLIAENPVRRIREDLGTEPKVHYIGL